MVANNEGQQAPLPGDPNDPSTFHPAAPRYVPLSAFDDTPTRPDSGASDQSSSSGFASQASYDGGVTLPPASVVSSSGHGSNQEASVTHTGASNAQVYAPTPVRFVRNISIHGAAHANPADFFTGGPTDYRPGPEVTASQPAPIAYIDTDGNIIINDAAPVNSTDVFTGGPTAYRAGPQVSASQTTFQAHANGSRTVTVNIPKNDRIYGNMNDNRLSSLDKPTYGGNRTKNSRTYGNGISRRSRGDNRIQGPPQAIAGGFGNNNAFAPDGSRPARVGYNAPQQYPVNRMLFQESPDNQVSEYQASSYPTSNYQPSSHQASNYPVSNYQGQGTNYQGQGSNYQTSNNQVSNYQVSNYQVSNYQASNNQVLAFRAQIPYQTQFPTPLTMFVPPPPNPFAALGRSRAAAIAAYIRSGAMDDGQPLDPAARTPTTTGSDRRQRRRTNSGQFETPTRIRGPRRNDYSGSRMSTPSRNLHAAGSHTIQPPRIQNTLRQPRQNPAWLREACYQHPTLDEALSSSPFSNPYEMVPSGGKGVVKFINIPYETSRNELLAALGRNARPVNMPPGSPSYAVHIILDRHTGKTGDGYVEMATARDALNTVRAIDLRAEDGSRSLKIGNREAVVQVSTPEELMEALFPHAGAVEWTGYTPRVIDVDTLFYRDQPRGPSFTGFCSSEELAMVVKFAENPSRSPFIHRTPYRLYECLISTMYRFPWHTPRYITLAQRKNLYDAVRHCMQALIIALDCNERERNFGISESLLREFATAALSCVGFTEQQKAFFVDTLADHDQLGFGMGRGMNVHLGGSGIFSVTWPFLALTPKAFVDSDLLKFYVSLISKASEDNKDKSVYDMAAAANIEHESEPFGRFAIDYSSQDMASLSLEDVVRSELAAIARVLSTVLLGGCSGPLYELA